VTFDGPLLAGSTDATQWTAIVGGPPWDHLGGSFGGHGTVSGNTVEVPLVYQFTDSGPQVAGYTPSPGDLFAADGRPIGAQANIPLTVV